MTYNCPICGYEVSFSETEEQQNIEMSKTITLSELGLYKSSLKRALLHFGRDMKYIEHYLHLLNRRGDRYSVWEARQIVMGCIIFSQHSTYEDGGYYRAYDGETMDKPLNPLAERAYRHALRQHERAMKILEAACKQS